MAATSESVILPSDIKHWINSFKTPSCALLSNLHDLVDGHCLCELVESIFQSRVSMTSESARTPAGRIQSALTSIGDAIGWNNIPPEFHILGCARIIAEGEPTLTIALLKFLQKVSLERNNSSGAFDADSDVERALVDLRSEKDKGVWPQPPQQATDLFEDFLTFRPAASNTYAAARDEDDESGLSDSLAEELHVTNRRDKVKGAHSHSQSHSGPVARPSLSMRASQSSTVRPPTRSRTPPLAFQHKQTGAVSTKTSIKEDNHGSKAVEHERPATGSQATVAQGSKTGLVKRRNATHPARKVTATAAHAPSTSTRTITATNKLLTAPAGITVRSGTGLTLGTGLVDPNYKAGPRSRFAETLVAAPPQSSSSSESESEDSMRRPAYDALFAGQAMGSQARALRDKALLNARMPHSRSKSPVGRRHVHCQLHSAVDATRPISRDRYGNSLVETCERHSWPEPALAPPSSSSGAHKERQQVQSAHSSHTHASAAHPHAHHEQLEHPQQRGGCNDHNQQSEVRARQAAQVLGVFQKQAADHQQRHQQHRHRREQPDIDSAVETDRKNVILEWIQRQLGVTLEVLLTATTSHPYNVGAGRKQTLSDAILVTRNSNHSEHTHDAGGHHKRRGSSGSVGGGVEKENYPFYPVPEDARYTPGRTSNMPGSYSIVSYLGQITQGMPPYTNNVAGQVAAQQRQVQVEQQELLQIPPHGPYVRPFNPSAGHKTPVTPVGFLNDPWVNGVLLSQIVAALFVENRALIKQAESFDRFGRVVSPPKLILAGTEFVVKSRARAMHNVQLCMEVISANVPGFPTLDYCAEDVLNGTVSLWRLLDSLYETVRHNMRHRNGSSGGSGGRGRARSRSTSPAGGPRGRAVRSISAPTPVREGEAGRVSFSDTTVARLQGKESPLPHRSRQTSGTSSSSSGRPLNSLLSRSRSASPSNRSVTSGGSSPGGRPRARSTVDAAAVSLLELRQQEKEHERVRARLYAQKKREQHQQHADAKTASKEGHTEQQQHQQATSAPAKEWVSSTVVERPRSVSAARRASVTSANGGAAASGPGAGAAASVASSDAPPHRAGNGKVWFPPKLSTVEVEAALHTPLPAVSVYQQRGIREWLVKTFNIRLLDAECGFSSLGGVGDADGMTPETFLPGGKTEFPGKYGAKVDARFEVISPHAPPPLPLPEDRLRNGVLLGQLLLRLEPNAARHAHIPKLLHKHPRSMPVCLENIERVLWMFKLRRCPPIPLQYLCQPEEILKGTTSLVWGLLWEIMQAYPYATISSMAEDRTIAESVGGALPAEARHVTPREGGPQQHRIPIRDGLARVFSQAADVAAARRKSTAARRASTTGPGLKGEEARHHVPSNMRYNYADPHLENPVAAHTLPYSDRQRHRLDLSLLHWLEQCGILTEIVGSLSQPVTILALESYCRDGTLFCMIAERVLKLTLAKEWHRRPSSYAECMSNLKHCLEVLRKCQNMRPRYLYSGVEEDICRGKWDSILGLLEDMHRFADHVHPHTQITNTVDAQGNVVRDAGGKDAFNCSTVEAPYLGSNAQFTAELEADHVATDQAHDQQEFASPSARSRARGPAETEWTPPGAFTAGLHASNSSRSNLLHDAPNAFAPALDLAPPPPADAPAPRPTAPGLAAQLQPPCGQHQHIADEFLNYKPQQGTAPVDLYPSNPVGGGNVVDVLSRLNEDGSQQQPPLHPRGHSSRGSRIPTPQRTRRSPSGSPTDTPDSPDSLPQPRDPARMPSAAPPRWEESRGGGRGSYGDAQEMDRAEGKRLALALNLTDSEVEARGRNTHRSPLTSPGKSHRGGPRSPAGASRSRSPAGKVRAGSRSPGKDRTPSPVRASPAPMTATAVRRFHLYNRRGLNTTAVSEFDADSLESGGYSAGSPDSVRDGAVLENITSNIDLHKVRKVLRWFRKVDLRVEHKNGNFARHTFSDGVLLCALLQRLERSGPLAGTYPHPRTHSERVQNVRRCLELLAVRHKTIPLRALSCEEDVLEGNIGRTIELLLTIRTAYATHRL